MKIIAGLRGFDIRVADAPTKFVKGGPQQGQGPAVFIVAAPTLDRAVAAVREVCAANMPRRAHEDAQEPFSSPLKVVPISPRVVHVEEVEGPMTFLVALDDPSQ